MKIILMLKFIEMDIGGQYVALDLVQMMLIQFVSSLDMTPVQGDMIHCIIIYFK